MSVYGGESGPNPWNANRAWSPKKRVGLCGLKVIWMLDRESEAQGAAQNEKGGKALM